MPARAATSLHAALFEAALAAQPQPLAAEAASAEVRPDGLHLRVDGLPPAWRGKALRVLPELAGVIDNFVQPAGQWRDGQWSGRVALSPQRSESPGQMPAVLVAEGIPVGVRVALKVDGTWPALPVAGAASPVAEALPAPAAPAIGWAAALLMALATDDQAAQIFLAFSNRKTTAYIWDTAAQPGR